uniref:Uncharacterized protein n=1 Tax=Lepeophtheirus salmonis TaxID=72036 RepID=A0A0K2U9S6_LEPSM
MFQYVLTTERKFQLFSM